MNREFYLKEAPRFVKIIAGVLVVVFVFLCVLLVRQFQHVRRMHQIDSYKILLNNVRTKAPLTLEDVPIIQSWMTFAYIDRLFNVPPEYLQSTLAVSDTHYPNISIGRYAKNQKIPTETYVKNVQTAVRGYLLSNH